MIPTPVLVFHLVRTTGTAKGFVYLITKLNNCVSFKLTKSLRSRALHFSKKSGRLSSVGPVILVYFKLKYEDVENLKADRNNTVVLI